MNHSTDKQKQKARERIWISPVETDSDWPVWATSNQWGDGIEYVSASLLSSRDAEIKEVLEGLRRARSMTGNPCWCVDLSTIAHEPACLAARTLWNKVQS